MPSKRDVLASLTRDELLDALDRCGVEVANRRGKDGLVDALSASHRAHLSEILEVLSRERLKALCRIFDLDDSGRQKALLVERLAGGGARHLEQAPGARPRREQSPQGTTTPGAPRSELSTNELEKRLWASAGALRNNMDESARLEAEIRRNLDLLGTALEAEAGEVGIARVTRVRSLDHAIVDDRKLADYLLSLAHPFGQAKARFLLALGFRRDDLEGLRQALLDHAAASPAVASQETEFGAKYVVEGPLTAPGGRAAIVRSVWFVERGSTGPRLVTVYPWKGARP